MQITIITIGSTGDVLPYTGLAARLAADGHEVAIATHGPFEKLVTSRGIGFKALPMNLEDEFASSRGQRALRTSAAGSTGNIALYLRHWRAMGEAVVEAAAGSDLLLVSAMGWQGIHVAEAMGIPSMGIYLQPMEPTAEFPPWTVTQRSLGARGNRAAAKAVRFLGQVPFRRATADLRRGLGLAPVGIAEHFARLDRQRWPVLHGWSPSVLPAPADWPQWRPVVGYWWPAVEPQWRPSTELTEFLDAGDPPVLITLGSMAPKKINDRLAGLPEALAGAGRRAIVQAGWAGLTGPTEGQSSDQLLVIGAAPHEWLLPRVAAVAHHGGAGTTAAGLRAGRPTVPLPLAADQPLWARRLRELGVAPTVLDPCTVTATGLVGALGRAADDEGCAAAVGRLAARLSDEDGAGAVAEAISSGRHW